MKKHTDKNMRSQEFNVGDKVMVKLLPQDPSHKHHQEYMVKWQGYTKEENTWERAVNLSAYNDKIEAYHMQKLTRASTALVEDNVMGCPLAPTMISTTPLHPSTIAPMRLPCKAHARPFRLALMRPTTTAPCALSYLAQCPGTLPT
ncbi:hypothetical protein RJ639_026259 [Escallonia herrerae]|uniref:Chromo domain-containing protein n=1 Tax=Escallonia herrerae TaxID=1293975 RepID=A0AA88RU85_9ASTE|nr:hypothetical protein RJ639_026259 [Escallonia herrerae]